MRRFVWISLLLILAVPVVADDGELQVRNVSKTPDWDTEHTSLQQLWFYVPTQTSDGTLGEVIEYYDADGNLVETREYARPLIAFYEDGPVEIPDDSGGFYGHGERDMNAAVSLDDGATWKRKNISKSASRSSIKIDGDPYPGDVFRNFTAASSNRVLAVWASRYCKSGSPNYAIQDIEEIQAIFASELVDKSHLGDEAACTDEDADGEDPTQCLYFEDYWGVAGSQGVKDFADEDYPSVGKVPYACMWAARGTLELLDDGTHEVVWRKAERLTSGRRDVHRMEAACVGGAGCVITWQEDPDGLRPGKGEGPGEGWSGAIAHHETDIWYSFIDWQNFDLVKDRDEVIMTLADYLAENSSGVPKVAVPLSLPVRLTDNAKCVMPGDDDLESDDPYCYMDFGGLEGPDICATSVSYDITTPSGPSQTVEMCVAEDGRLMRGNTASTRTRTNLRGYDSTADMAEGVDSGWVILAYEESKGLGDEAETDEDDVDKIDMGKNIWYHTFDMFDPELVSQGLMLNQPAIYPRDFTLGTLNDTTLELEDASAYTGHEAGGDFAVINPDPIYSQVDLESTLYQTEIARRYSQITQPASWVGESGTVALAMYKQGIVRQGGPADVFARRFVIPDGFDPGVDNPFDYSNMDCEDWIFDDGLNPRYVKGLCLSTPQNLSGTTLVDCEDGIEECEVLDFPIDDLFADIDKSDSDGDGGISKMTEWRQCQDGVTFTVTGDEVTPFDCDDDDLDDQSWENPYDLSKGHRGFMYGDFIMQMYAWSPNWEANTMAHDNYNLYVRRSFDGGQSWTTLPSADFMDVPDGVEIAADGTMSCEWFGVPGSETETAACFTYGAGDFEQARNLSQLVGSQFTVLDPRFSGTDPGFLGDLTKDMVDGVLVDDGVANYTDDFVDPSKFFATFEEGDTGEIADGGEGTPMDMFYARAINFGDEYELADVIEDGVADVDPTDDEFEIFDKLEWHEAHAAEAALKASPGGTFFYAIWNEWKEDEDGHAFESDATVRRIMELVLEDGDCVTTPSGGGGEGEGSVFHDGFETGNIVNWH